MTLPDPAPHELAPALFAPPPPMTPALGRALTPDEYAAAYAASQQTPVPAADRALAHAALDAALPPAPPPLRASQGRKVRALGVPLTLANGETVELRYGMSALVALEDEFGSLGAVQDVLGSIDAEKPVLRPVVKLLACGLAHLGITYTQLLELLDPADLETYSNVAGQAFALAFPDAVAGPGNVPGATATPPARGTSGSTSAPSPSAEPTPSSGG